MSKVASNVGPKGPQFIIEMGGQHDVTMSQVTVGAAFNEGDIIENVSTLVSGTSTEVFGIVTKDCSSGDVIPVLTLGQPTTVDFHKLNYNTATQADIDALLMAKQIVVVEL